MEKIELKKVRTDFSVLTLCLFFFYVLHNILHLTVENITKNINRMGAYTLIPLQSCDLCGADVMLFNQGIL